MLRFDSPRFTTFALVLLAMIALAPARPARADINSFRAVPTAFSPNGDGRRDVTLLSWNVAGATADTIQIAVRRSSASVSTPPLRTFTFTGRPVGRDSVEWDGLDDNGALLPDTLYSLRLTERSAAGTLVGLLALTVDLDTTPPDLPTIDGPADTVVTDSSYIVAGIAAHADTVIVFRGGAPFDTLAASGDPAAFGLKVRLAEGANSFAVQSYDRAFNLSPQTTAINVRYVNTPDLSAPRATPATFSPNGDGVLDSTRVVFSIDAPTTRLLVTVRSGPIPSRFEDLSLPVDNVYDGPAAAGAQSFTWGGRDSVGATVADGPYFFRVSAESLSTDYVPIPSTLQKVAPFVLDTTPPLPPTLTSPLPATTIYGTVTAHVHTVQGDSLFTRSNGVLVSRISTPSTATTNVVVPLLLGDNDLTFQSKDFAGNESLVSGPFRVVYEAPLGFHAPERFGHGDAFVVNVTKPAREVVIDLFTLRGRPMRRLFLTQTRTRYELPWDLNDESGSSVGDGPYLARLQVTYVDGSVEERKAAIVVIK
jgi:hypothetical protein